MGSWQGVGGGKVAAGDGEEQGHWTQPWSVWLQLQASAESNKTAVANASHQIVWKAEYPGNHGISIVPETHAPIRGWV